MAVKFQSTPLREGRLSLLFTPLKIIKFQSTPLREGRLAYSDTRQCEQQVSIHAPARGATRIFSKMSLMVWFQSTPLREGRH